MSKIFIGRKWDRAFHKEEAEQYLFIWPKKNVYHLEFPILGLNFSVGTKM